MSETSLARKALAPYCVGMGIDLGFGGDPIREDAITFDMPQPYTEVGKHPQILRGDARSLTFICDNALDYVYSSHLLEDFYWTDLIPIVREWRRVLKPGGAFVTCCPDEQVYRKHCEATGQHYNAAHKNADFSLENFRKRVISETGPWEDVYADPLVDTYSWHFVCRKA